MTIKTRSHVPAFGIILIAAVLLPGCGGQRVTPEVSDQAMSLRFPETRYRTVFHGDTLYSIAWESGRDYRELAAWNNIPPPYTIHVGQRLRLFPPRHKSRPARRSVETRPNHPPQAIVRSDREAAGHIESHALPRTRHTQGSPRQRAVQTGPGPWVWPAKGKIIGWFNHSGTENGLDIAGWRGEPVFAAAAGKVVYQGSGLRGYGQLIIIKHNDDYFSAYAHNNRILVRDGEWVKRGQKIAEMGDTGTDKVKLHFEIRRHGSPVNPLRYLPKL